MPRLARRMAPLLVALGLLSAGCGASASGSSGGSSFGFPSTRTVVKPHKIQTQPGDLAPDYFSTATYPALRVYIDFLAGPNPPPEAIYRATRIWEKRLGKTGGVDVVLGNEIPAKFKRDRWEVGDVLALEDQFRTHWSGDANNPDTAVIWMVYLNGASEFDDGFSRALGVAIGGSDIAIFQDNLEATTKPGLRDIVQAMVLVHESGHLLGLTNNGLPMYGGPHEDADFPRHDASPDCVMHHMIETGDATRLLSNPPIDFDLACRIDLYEAGGPDPEAPPGTDLQRATATPAQAPVPHPGGRGPIPDMAVVPLDLRK